MSAFRTSHHYSGNITDTVFDSKQNQTIHAGDSWIRLVQKLAKNAESSIYRLRGQLQISGTERLQLRPIGHPTTGPSSAPTNPTRSDVVEISPPQIPASTHPIRPPSFGFCINLSKRNPRDDEAGELDHSDDEPFYHRSVITQDEMDLRMENLGPNYEICFAHCAIRTW